MGAVGMMLAKLNQRVGALLVWLGAALGAAARFMAPVLRRVLGVWSPPAWLRWLGRGAGWVGAKLQAYALLSLLVLALAGAAAWQAPHIALRWRAWTPAWMNFGLVADKLGAASVSLTVAPPGPLDYAGSANPAPNPLVVTFSAPAAPPLRIGKEAQDVQMSPELAGRWMWLSHTQLSFTPKQDWPVGQHYSVKLGAKALAAHVELKERSFEFDSASFVATLGRAEFYQDPTQPGVRRVVVQLGFNQPVDTQSLESRLTLDDGTARKFSVSYDKYKLQATVQSEPLPIPAQTVAMTLRLAPGVTAQRGGPGTKDELRLAVDVPGLYSLAIAEISTNVVSNDNGDPEHVLHVTASMAVHEREMAKAVQAWLLPVSDKEGGAPFAWSDPAEVSDAVLQRAKLMKLEALPSEREITESASFRLPQAEGGRYLLVRVRQGLKSPGGYQLGAVRNEVLLLKTFAPELAIMSRGSLLALSGDKKLPLLVRDLPGIDIDIARVLPQQLHLLVSQASGDFSHPRFDGNVHADHLTEHFERKLPLKLRPGKSHYETVDFSDYLKAGGTERRGVFLLKVHGYDPKLEAKKPAPRADDDAANAESGTEGQDAPSQSEPPTDPTDPANPEAAQFDPQQIQDQRLVIVTDLGLIAKRSADGTRDVFVQSITTGAPVPGATIEAWGRNGLVLTSATTDAKGRASLPNLSAYTRDKQAVLLLARKDGDLSFLPLGGSAASLGRGDRTLDMSRFDVGGLRTSGVPNQMTAFLFSDRGIYRPGDSLHVGIVVKAANWATVLKGMPVEAEVMDARGLSVRRETLYLGPSGTAEFSYATQDSSPTGNYTINLSLPRLSSPNAPDVPALLLGSTSVKVQEFLPDRTKVTARLSAPVPEGWISPQDLKLLVNVQNLFGTPAQQRRIETRMTLSPTWPSFARFADYSFYDPSMARQAQTDDLASTQSDTQGNAEIDLRLNRFEAATYQAHLLVKAFEPEGGRSVAAEVQALVSDRPYLVGLKSNDALNYIARGAKREVQWLAVDAQLKSLAVAGLKLVRVEHKTLSVLVKQNNGLYRYESRAKDVTLDEQPLKLPAGGALVALNTSTPGNFGLQLRDAQGLVLNRVEYSVAGAANLSRALDRNAELQIKLSKKDYQPGEELELSIQAPYTGAGLITIERDKVYAHAWFKTDKTASVQHITLPADFEGNGYVSVQFVRDPASDEIYTSPLSYGAVPFATGLSKRTAHIKLSASELIKPGDTLKMKLSSDRPARAFVFAVDEGILQVARYATPDPLKHFFQKRALEVSTLQTLDLILPEFRKLMQGAAPGGDGAGEAGKQLNPFKRKRDKPVAFWSGLVEVNGDKEFSYPVPDNFNGALRVMAVVVSDDAVASATSKATVRGDIVLLPTIPTAISPGDTVDIGIGVANNIAGSGQGAPIKLALEARAGLEVVGDAAQTLKINERGEATAVFHVKAKTGAQAVLGSASLIFTATHAKASAKLSTDVSVRPASALVTLVQSGTALGAGELKSQLDAYPNFARSDLAVSATPWAFASGLIRYLEDYPHGCTEQIASQTLPAVVLASQPDLARELAKTRSTQGQTPFDAKLALGRAVAQLRARQSADGGFALWPGNGPDDFATVYALQLLLEAKERKLAVPPDLISKANTYVQSRLGAGEGGGYGANAGWRTRTQMAYMLTRQGILVPAALANLRDTLRADVRSNASRPANYRLDTDLGAAYLAASYQLLKQDAAAQELMAPVWGDLVQRVQAKKTRSMWDYYYDPLVHDSMLIVLVARHFPQKLQALPTDTWSRLAVMIGDGWYSTQSSASTILAVDAYARAAAAAAQGKFNASVVDAAGKAQPLPLVGDLRVLMQAVVPQGTARVKLANPGGLPLFYGWAESGYERRLPDTAISHGLEITQVILNDKGVAVSEAKIGEDLTVKLTVRALDRDAVRQVALVNILPSGLEPVIQPTDADDADPQTPIWRRRLGGSGSWALTYADMREDRVIFFGDISPSAQEISFKARATNVGQFAMPAAFAEAMYERRVFGRSAAGRFTVTPVAK
jgi:uncharacterized protein YfaS (alpha-2-macroglobulin family)